MPRWSAFSKPLWLLLVSNFVNSSGAVFLPFLVIYLTQHMGYTDTVAANLFILYGIVGAMAGPLGGRLADSLSSVRLQAVFLAFSGVMLVVFAYADSLLWIAIAISGVSFGTEGYRAINVASIAKLAPPEQKTVAFAVSRLLYNLAIAMAVAIGGVLSKVSFPALFILDGSTALLAASFIFCIGHPTLKIQISKSSQENPANGQRPWLVHAFLFANFLLALVLFQGYASVPLFFTDQLGYSPTTYGFLLSVLTMMMVCLELPIVIFTKTYPSRLILAGGALLIACGYGLLTFAHGNIAIGAAILWTFGAMFYYPRAAGFVSEIVPPDRVGKYMGLFMMKFTVASIAGPWIGIQTLQRYGADLLWPGTFILAFLAAAIMIQLSAHPTMDPKA